MVSSLIGVAVSAPDVWPSVVSTAAVIAVAMLLSGDLRAVGFVWIAWAMSFALLLLLGNRAGIGADSLHLVSLVWGALLLLGGLAFDDRRSGRRQPGEGLRIGWLRQPVLLGALAMPVSVGPVFVEGPEVFGWWTLGVAVAYLIVAWLVRVGAVSAVGYTLGAVAAVALTPWDLLDEPWRLVVVATPLVALSWWLARTKRDAADPWLRWDVAPLIVAHAIGGFALVYATARGGLAATGLAFALLHAARNHQSQFPVGPFARRYRAIDVQRRQAVMNDMDVHILPALVQLPQHGGDGLAGCDNIHLLAGHGLTMT